MSYFICVILGYLLGSISPAALISKLKHVNLRRHGTGNLGATNTLLTFGKYFFIVVLVFDMAKGFAAVRLAEHFFAGNTAIGAVAGGAAMIGHIWPFYMKFKGGKGLATFGGIVLGADPVIFCILLVITLVLIVVINHGIAMPISAALLFPVMYWLRGAGTADIIVTGVLAVIIIIKNRQGLLKAIHGEDVKVRPFIKKYVFKKED